MIGDKFKEVRKALKLTQLELANELGLNVSAIAQFETNRNKPSLDTLIKLSDAHNINLNWLLTGTAEMFLAAEEEKAGRQEGQKGEACIRLDVAGRIAAGEPIRIETGQEPLGKITVARNMLPLHGRYVAFQVAGESMFPLIHNGDIVVVDTDIDPAVLDQKICAFRIDGGITLKRLIYDHELETTWLFPVNHDYTARKFHWDDVDITIVGVMRLLIRKY